MAHYGPSYLDLHCLHRYLFWCAKLKGLCEDGAQIDIQGDLKKMDVV